MTASTWATLLITFAVAISMPGPDLFMLLRLGVRSRRAAILAACGIMVGNTIWTLASLLGLSALLQALPGALPTLQLLGSAVLIWMGTQSIRGGLRAMREAREFRRGSRTAQHATDSPPTALTANEADSDTGTGTGTGTGSANIGTTATRHPLRLGLITNLSNPKALLFFAALFSQILPNDAGWIDRAAILLALTIVGLAWFVSFALLASSRAFQRWFGRATPVIDVVAGAVFLLVAAVILFELAITVL